MKKLLTFILGLFLCSATYAQLFGAQNIIEQGTIEPIEAISADLDGDGDFDIVVASATNELLWYENDGLGNFGPKITIYSASSACYSVTVDDIDSDGDIDIVCGTNDFLNPTNSGIFWFANNGLGVFSTANTVSTSFGSVYAVETADFNGDGHIDIVAASFSGGKYSWFQNDGTSSVFTENIVDSGLSQTIDIRPADLDGDGDIDLVGSCNVQDVGWYLNDGSGNFGNPSTVLFAQAFLATLFLSDLNGDQDFDIVIASRLSGPDVLWIANDGSANYNLSPPNNVFGGTPYEPSVVFCGDFDLDGDNDLIWGDGGGTEINWHSNNGSGGFSIQELVTNASDFTNSIHANDLDGDGDLDILSVSINDDKLAWYENQLNRGCTSPTACNFNASANVDDGSCIEPTGCDYCDVHSSGVGILVSGDCNGNGVCDINEIAGCTYSFAANYNPTATLSDGSCTEKCQGDFNGDNTISTADLLFFLTLQGNPCVN